MTFQLPNTRQWVFAAGHKNAYGTDMTGYNPTAQSPWIQSIGQNSHQQWWRHHMSKWTTYEQLSRQRGRHHTNKTIYTVNKIPETVSVLESVSCQRFKVPFLRKYVLSNFQVIVAKSCLINERWRCFLQVPYHNRDFFS